MTDPNIPWTVRKKSNAKCTKLYIPQHKHTKSCYTLYSQDCQEHKYFYVAPLIEITLVKIGLGSRLACLTIDYAPVNDGSSIEIIDQCKAQLDLAFTF